MFSVHVKPKNEQRYVANSLAFPTKEDARAYGINLTRFWTLIESWIIVDENGVIHYYYPPYEPREDDIQWFQNMVMLIKEGGVWCWPDTSLMYMIVHPVKVLELKNPELILKNPVLYEKHRRTAEVCKAVGWKVLPSQFTD